MARYGWRLTTEAALIERDSDPCLFAPYDMAGPLKLVARHEKHKAVGDEERAHNFKRAPLSEMFRTVQSIPPPLNSIVPALNVRRREATRLWSIKPNETTRPPN
jgi:hypothetical protein